jgi:DtxR family transcriptional regulator, Mn-dependent transcriptional regulator
MEFSNNKQKGFALATNNFSREDYLKCILHHQLMTGQEMPMGALAESVGVAGPSVTGMVKILANCGWLTYTPRKGVKLTDSGFQIAAQVIRRHRLIELFLVRTLNLDWAEVHDEAEVIEHALSEKLLLRIDEHLGHPTFDPHGDPIPNATGRFPERKLQPLELALAGHRYIVRQIVDQSSEFLGFIGQAGFTPSSLITVERVDLDARVIVIGSPAGIKTPLPLSAATNILVEQVKRTKAIKPTPRTAKH